MAREIFYNESLQAEFDKKGYVIVGPAFTRAGYCIINSLRRDRGRAGHGKH